MSDHPIEEATINVLKLVVFMLLVTTLLLAYGLLTQAKTFDIEVPHDIRKGAVVTVGSAESKPTKDKKNSLP